MPIASFGVVLGHMFVYRHLFADTTHRHEVLEQSGHGYLNPTSLVVCALALIALGLHMWLGYKSKEQHRHSQKTTYGFWSSFLILCITQLVLFIFMELTERAVTHGWVDALEFFNSSIFSFGILFQIVAAAVTALAVSSAVKAGEFIARLIATTQVESGRLYPEKIQVVTLVLQKSLCIRGPPNLYSLAR